MKSRHKKLLVIVLGVTGIGIAAALILNAFQSNLVFFFSPTQVARGEAPTDRAFRIGQTRNVMVHKFICGGTLEERIDAMIERKTALADEIVSSGESFLTEMSNDELREILRLSDASVTDDEDGVSGAEHE